MIGIEGEEQRHDRVPRVGPCRADQIAAHFACETAGRGDTSVDSLVIALRDRFEGAEVEDAHVASESSNHQALIDGRDGSRGARAAGVNQELEPLAEALHVEPFVAPWLRAAPEIEVEDRGELLGCRCGDELSTGVESAVSNELMQCLGRQMRHDSREVWRLEQTRESMFDGTSVVRCRGDEDPTRFDMGWR